MPETQVRPHQDKLFEMSILVVDDEPGFREIFSSLLEIRGYAHVRTAENGAEALRMLEAGTPVDLILTDVNMPEVDGYRLLELIKSSPSWSSIPVIMISGAGQLKNVIQCVRLGAEDYLMKPLEQELLWARVHASLERKYLRDREQALFEELNREKQKSEKVLYSVIPKRIADRLRQGEHAIAEHLPCATIVFADIVGFSRIAQTTSAEVLLRSLNTLFLSMDHVASRHRLEKIKTVGDCYMCAGGLNLSTNDHPDRCVAFAKDIVHDVRALNTVQPIELSLRIGIASGPVVAGIIGRMRPMFDIWGATVNLASRMESHGMPDCVQISESTYQLLSNKDGFVERDLIEVKGLGPMRPYLLRL